MLYYDATHYADTIDTLVERADEVGEHDGSSDAMCGVDADSNASDTRLAEYVGHDGSITPGDWSAIRTAYALGYWRGYDHATYSMRADAAINAAADRGESDGANHLSKGVAFFGPSDDWVAARIGDGLGGLTDSDRHAAIVAYGVGYRRTNKYAVAAS